MKLGIWSLVVPTVLTLGACSGRTTDTNAAVADTANTAAAPPYPNATIGFLVNTGLYQFQSTDDTTTVSDWYTSHVNTSWHKDATYDSRSTVVNGVQIAISKISGPAGNAASAKTMITLSLP